MDIKNIFGKVQELRNARFDDDDDDIIDSAVSSDDYEDARGPQKFSSGIFEDEEDTGPLPKKPCRRKKKRLVSSKIC